MVYRQPDAVARSRVRTLSRYKARPIHARTTPSLETTECMQLLLCQNHPSLASRYSLRESHRQSEPACAI